MDIILILAIIVTIVGCLFYQSELKPSNMPVKSETVDPYIETALQFLEFYHCLSNRDHLRPIITEEYIGVMLSDDDTLGVHALTCKGLEERGDLEALRCAKEAMVNYIETLCSDGQGRHLFYSLSLYVRLHNDDPDRPVILKWLFCKDILEREKHIRVIERQYELIYHEKIKILSAAQW